MIKEKMKQLVGKSIKAYNNEYSKPKMDELKFKEQYQGRIIDCMVGEVDDNYIETPLTDENVVKLEYSKEGVVKIPSIKGKTILVDSEGNETDTPGEGCRLISVGEDEDNRLLISSKNKNIFDGEIERYFINSSTGQNNGWMEYWRSKDYIRCTPNEKHLVHFKYKDVKKYGAMFFYDKDKKYIGMSYTNPTVTPSNCELIRIAGQAENSGTLIDITKVTDVMLCKGVDVADYIEPKQHKTEILLDEPLREINGFIQDEIVDNILYKNVGYKVIDSSLLTNMYIEVTNGYCRITTNNNTLNDWIGKTSNNNKDILLYREGEKIAWKWNWHDSTIEHFYASNSNKTLSIIISQDKIDTMEGSNFREKVKKYFDKTKFEVFYNIKKIEELPNSITLQGFDDTTMYIENSITPTVSYGYNALIPYKQEILNQQQEVETNTLDIEQNIIPYLMDMEFNLMLMEDE